jgi:hypothetical protein
VIESTFTCAPSRTTLYVEKTSTERSARYPLWFQCIMLLPSMALFAYVIRVRRRDSFLGYLPIRSTLCLAHVGPNKIRGRDVGVVWRRQMIPLHRRNAEGLFSMLDVEVEGWELHDKCHMGWRIMEIY